MEFVDLFAGLGGFHLALKRLNHTCVFACELDDHLRVVYEKNFGLMPAGNIRDIRLEDIPRHDILCAGFPCQPFSKAGGQRGFDDPKWGDLFGYVLRIVQHHRPQYIILENVANLEKHNDGRTWERIECELKSVGYDIRRQRLSPHRFGIPQVRERLFVVGSRSSLTGFEWPTETRDKPLSIVDSLEEHPADVRRLSPMVLRCLKVWQDFLDRFPKDCDLPSFPVWSMEFGATYPYEDTTPFAMSLEELRAYRGSQGQFLRDLSALEVMRALPSHARRPEPRFPKWKINFIRQNRELYTRHREWIDEWLPQVLEFPSSLQKLEWNCKNEPRNIWRLVIQFRASGVRVKRPTTSPSLIAMNTTQVPIIGWQSRYMTPRECANLQSMRGLEHLPESPSRAFRALGNAVNVDLVEMVASALLSAGQHTPPPTAIARPDTRNLIQLALGLSRGDPLEAPFAPP